MLDSKLAAAAKSGNDASCDVRIWSKDCEHMSFDYIGDKYSCDVCESIAVLNHEVRPATMPYVSGDYTRLS